MKLDVIIPLIMGYLIDSFLGDPRNFPHPIVLFGHIISFLEKKLNNGKRLLFKSFFIALILPLGTWAIFYGIEYYALMIDKILFYAIATIFVFYGLANKTLVQESFLVINVLKIKGVDNARLQLARIVGRDTSQLSEKEIYAAVLETMSENLSDGVVAPLFYYAIGGFPLMMAYKIVNTLDSMIGYKTDRYVNIGRYSALLDDILNWIPARITAFLMVIVSLKFGTFRFIYKYHNKHSSPNSGYPESALAGILNCRFGGGHIYHGEFIEKPFIGDNDRDFSVNDFVKAAYINNAVALVSVLSIAAIYWWW